MSECRSTNTEFAERGSCYISNFLNDLAETDPILSSNKNERGELKSRLAFTIGFRKDGGDGLRHEELILARKKGRKLSRLQINLTVIKMSNRVCRKLYYLLLDHPMLLENNTPTIFFFPAILNCLIKYNT